MKLVIKDDKVFAIHNNNQDIENLYPDCSFVIDDAWAGNVGDEYEITPQLQFQLAVQYQHDAYNEYAREIVYQIQYNTALSNTTLILNLEEQLQLEQQAVIARINAITEAYNESNE